MRVLSLVESSFSDAVRVYFLSSPTLDRWRENFFDDLIMRTEVSFMIAHIFSYRIRRSLGLELYSSHWRDSITLRGVIKVRVSTFSNVSRAIRLPKYFINLKQGRRSRSAAWIEILYHDLGSFVFLMIVIHIL
jgi:hypothetical protein